MDRPILHNDLMAELRSLRAEVEVLRQHVTRPQVPVRHGWLKLVVKDLETNPHTQYKVHLYGVVYWLANFPLITALFFFEPALWLKLGVFITLIYSIYANMATDYGAMSASMAAFGQDPPPEIPLEVQPPSVPGQG